MYILHRPTLSVEKVIRLNFKCQVSSVKCSSSPVQSAMKKMVCAEMIHNMVRKRSPCMAGIDPAPRLVFRRMAVLVYTEKHNTNLPTPPVSTIT